MENTSRLLFRHDAELAGRHWLLVDADDAALATLPGASRCWHSDRPDGAATQSSMLPAVPPETDLLIVVLPKSLPRLHYLVAALAGQLSRATELWLVGAAKGGIKGGVSQLARLGVEMALVDSARHCKLFRGFLSPAPFEQTDFERRFEVDDVTVCSLPGVFSEARLDAGTRLLLDALQDQTMPATALDIGCGAGVISAWLARRGVAVTAVDISATAVACTEATLAANSLTATVRQSHLFSDVSGRFQWLVTNPPFHQGREQTFAVTRELLQQAPRMLTPGGALWLVANRHLPYDQWLQSAFSQVEIMARNSAFTVYRAGHG